MVIRNEHSCKLMEKRQSKPFYLAHWTCTQTNILQCLNNDPIGSRFVKSSNNKQITQIEKATEVRPYPSKL